MYKVTEEVLAMLPRASWDDCKEASPKNMGQECKCAECGQPAKNFLGLRVHFQSKHSDLPGVPGMSPRGTYKPRTPKPLVTHATMIPMQPQPKQQPSSSSVTFCPGCGCNIKAVAMAMRLTR